MKLTHNTFSQNKHVAQISEDLSNKAPISARPRIPRIQALRSYAGPVRAVVTSLSTPTRQFMLEEVEELGHVQRTLFTSARPRIQGLRSYTLTSEDVRQFGPSLSNRQFMLAEAEEVLQTVYAYSSTAYTVFPRFRATLGSGDSPVALTHQPSVRVLRVET